MTFPEIDAFSREAERAERTLAAVDPDRWTGPGLGVWTLAELTFHLVRQADRLAAYHDRPVSAEQPALDRFAYCRGAAALSADVAARARDGAAGIDPATLPAAFADAWRASVAAASAPDALIETVMGPMRTDEFTATRVLEVVVHHMDVRRCLDLPPDADPVAARLVTALLEGLLDGGRPRNLGRTRFILAATGRTAVADPRFPVFG